VETSRASDRFSVAARILWAALAALPFLSLYLAHYANPHSVPTGFIHGDMPYYSANGRAVFERGNGWAHPNPYDPDPDAPVIYFHWFTWILGYGIKKFGLDPGLLFAALGVVGSLACSYLTLRLVETRRPDGRDRIPLFLFTMWGGGLYCLGRAVQNLLQGRPAADSLFVYDPFDGWWFQNWGRNLIFPTEAVYHALVAGVWLAVLSRRWKLAVAATAVLAATHPFSGLQVFLILLAWFSILLWRERTGNLLGLWLTVVALLALFLGYYFIFLESFPQHRSLRETWSLSWTLDSAALVLGYGPIFAIAASRVCTARSRLDAGDCFLIVSFAVSFLLAKHECFMAPRQPLHFTRGHLWLPLCLLALPALQNVLMRARHRLAPESFRLILLGLGMLAVSDNAAFLVRQGQNQWQNSPEAGFFLTPAERDMFTWIDSQGFDGVLLSPDAKLSYLSATYTAVRPYFGHWSETPQFRRRIGEVRAWLEEGEGGSWLAAMDYVLIARNQVRSFHRLAGWEIAHENEELLFLKRPAK